MVEWNLVDGKNDNEQTINNRFPSDKLYPSIQRMRSPQDVRHILFSYSIICPSRILQQDNFYYDDNLYSHFQPDEWVKTFMECSKCSANDLNSIGAKVVSSPRLQREFTKILNVCRDDRRSFNRTCSIYKVPKGNDTAKLTCGSQNDLCEGYFVHDGERVIAWWNFNNYVRLVFVSISKDSW